MALHALRLVTAGLAGGTARYDITSTTGLTAGVTTQRDVIDILTKHLSEHLPAGPVGWTITSPSGLVYQGRLNLNGLTDQAAAAITTQMNYVAGNLAEETPDRPTPGRCRRPPDPPTDAGTPRPADQGRRSAP